jgi:hypothetical protein
MKAMRTIAIAAALLLAACASTEKARESWVGATYDETVKAWGAPARSAKLADGSDVHTWVAEGGPTYRSGASVGFGIGGIGFGGGGRTGVGVGASVPIGEGSPTPPARCERTMTFRDGRLVEQSWIGADEVCSTFGREAKKQP